MEENNQNENQTTEPIQNLNPIPDNNGKGKAVASLVLGIVSLVFAWFGTFAVISIILAVLGIIFGVMAKKTVPAGETGMATAGLVISIIGLCLSAIMFIACVACIGAFGTLGILQ